MYNKCLVCGATITWRFAICANCEKIYGRSALDWEPWLRFLWNEKQRQRRRQKRINEKEIPLAMIASLAEDDYDDECYCAA